ncbi:MAG: nitroreductase, partial [Deltaproteobacteria bacterium]
IGFAHEAMKNDSSIAREINIPGHEKIHAVIALGYPNEMYQSITGRKKPVTRFI